MEFGIPTIWAKAMTDDHARILRQLGIGNVLQPEAEMGRRLAATLIDPAHAAPLGGGDTRPAE
jgi:trk system potassium uptake protein TrkA